MVGREKTGSKIVRKRAAKPKAKKNPKRNTEAVVDDIYTDIAGLSVRLTESSFNLEAIPDGANIEDVKHGYICTVKIHEMDDGRIFGLFDCEITKALDELTIVQISASYLYFAKLSEKAKRASTAIAISVAKGTVWSRFQGFFDLIVAQANLDMPKLPLNPEIKIEESTKEGKESSD